MSPPRPILKRAPRRHNNVVHFPSSPILTRIFPAHSPATYDRTPIVVETNLCALPERGCPGRTYTLVEGEYSVTSDDGGQVAPVSTGKHLHPRAVRTLPLEDCTLDCARKELLHSPAETSLERLRYTPALAADAPFPPPLIPDLSSSESEESDGVASPPVEHIFFPMPSTIRSRSARPASIPMAIPTKPDDAPSTSFAQFLPTSPDSSTALSFLPHPPSPPEGSRPRRRRDKARQYRGEPDDTVDEDAESERSVGLYKHLEAAMTLTTCSLNDGDEGCLAGF